MTQNNIYTDLNITEERLKTLLGRDSYTPTLAEKPTEDTTTYIDANDGSEHLFEVGQLCTYPDGISVLKSITAEGKRIWNPVPSKISELIEDEAHRSVKDAEKTSWNNKQNTSDDNLQTTDKSITGAINEINAQIGDISSLMDQINGEVI